MQDVGRGAANLAGAPFDMTNALGNLLLTGADNAAQVFGGGLDYRLPIGASDTIANAGANVADLFGAESIPWEDRSRQERMAGNMIDFGTQALTGGAGLAKAAAKRAPQIVEGAKNTIADAFTRPYLENASRTVVGDTASGLGSGLAVDIADEYFPDSPLAHGVAAFFGGLGGSGAAELAQAGGRFVSDVTRPITFRTYDPQVPIDPATNYPARRTDVETAARMMQSLTRDPLTGQSRAPAAAQSIGERADEFRAAGLPVPTSGIISDNVGLYSAESAARTREGVPFIERDTRLRSAASDRVGGLRDPDADQSAVTTRARQVRDERMAPAENAVAAARAGDEAATAARQAEGAPLNLARGSDTRANASRNLDRAVVEDTYLPDRAHKNELYRAIDPEGVEMRAGRTGGGLMDFLGVGQGLDLLDAEYHRGQHRAQSEGVLGSMAAGMLDTAGAIPVPGAKAVTQSVKRVANNLPMDEASRLARADNFHMNIPLYHGTNQAFPEFDLAKGGSMLNAAPGRQAVWTALSPDVAEEFAQTASDGEDYRPFFDRAMPSGRTPFWRAVEARQARPRR